MEKISLSICSSCYGDIEVIVKTESPYTKFEVISVWETPTSFPEIPEGADPESILTEEDNERIQDALNFHIYERERIELIHSA